MSARICYYLKINLTRNAYPSQSSSWTPCPETFTSSTWSTIASAPCSTAEICFCSTYTSQSRSIFSPYSAYCCLQLAQVCLRRNWNWRSNPAASVTMDSTVAHFTSLISVTPAAHLETLYDCHFNLQIDLAQPGHRRWKKSFGTSCRQVGFASGHFYYGYSSGRLSCWVVRHRRNCMGFEVHERVAKPDP